MRITIKANRPTGRFKSFYDSYIDIKCDGEIIGSIENEVPHKIRLHAIKKDINEDGNLNCKWRWKTVKASFNNIAEVKKYVNDNKPHILKIVGLK